MTSQIELGGLGEKPQGYVDLPAAARLHLALHAWGAAQTCCRSVGKTVKKFRLECAGQNEGFGSKALY